MKNLISIYISVLIVIFIFSCEDRFKPDYSAGESTAVKNGEEWKGVGRGYESNQGYGIGMYFTVSDDFGQLRQFLSFIKIPIIKQTNFLFNTSGQINDSIPGCRFYTVSHDGDVLEDTYFIKEDGSTLTVDSYEDEARILKGTFDLKLYIDPDEHNQKPENPDTIIFEGGKFEVYIEE